MRRRRHAGSWLPGDRCAAEFEGELYPGRIVAVYKRGDFAKVAFDDGENLKVQIGDLRTWHDPEEDPTVGEGFNQYPIRWRDTNFSFTVDKTRFYGSWRRAEFDSGDGNKLHGYALDMWAVHNAKTYLCDSNLVYPLGKDPRSEINNLNRDLCSAANLWLFEVKSKVDGVHMLDDVHKRATRPTIRFTRLGTLDTVIRRLMEYRETALRAGGERVIGIEGDDAADPVIEIHINLTDQAAALRGSRTPNLFEGQVFDKLGNKRKDGSRGDSPLALMPDEENVDALLELLASTDDVKQKRRIRATLRKIGHKGGGRGKKSKAAEKPTGTLDTPKARTRRKNNTAKTTKNLAKGKTATGRKSTKKKTTRSKSK